MSQATITARVDEHDKADFDAFCSNVGLNTSTAIMGRLSLLAITG